ncbi:MAG TPA: LysE family transporter [Bacteroidales bacterium]|jgi:threonine/homoserine/homoserine lactone efflux protein|nr:LysE family transporter [Bacteroidales bacterium]
MHPLLQGMILGFTLAALLGPALFTLLQTSIHSGWRSGIFLATGIIISDFSVLMLAYLGALQIINKKDNYLIAGIIGGIILILFGIYTFNRKVHFDENNNPVEIKVAGPLTYILKGYFLNIMNPFVWFFWISAMVGVSSNFGDDKHGILIFFSGTLLVVFATDILKVLVASKLKRYLNGRILLLINHAVGILLVGFGIFLMIRTVLHF